MHLSERLQECFDSADHAQTKEYLSTVRDAWRDVSTALTRNAWIIVLLVVAFELADHRAVTTVTIGPFALQNIKYVRLFIPAIVSYLLYEQVLLAARWIETEEVHRYLTRILSPKVEKYDFDAFLAPRLPALSNLVHSYSSTSATPSKSVRAAAQYALSMIMLAAVPVFDGIALNQLSAEFKIGDILFWVNVAVTTGLIGLSITVAVLWLSEERLVVLGGTDFAHRHY